MLTLYIQKLIMTNIKKVLISLFVVASFVIFAITRNGNTATTIAANTAGTSGATNLISNSTSANSSTSANTGTSNSSSTSIYKDGTYTGMVADAYYGNVQVKVTVSGGNITDVTFVDYPHDRSTSREINSQAMPYLKSEAISAQSANVNIISGATLTSEAFIQSLQSALTKARA